MNKKFLLSGVLILALGAFIVYERFFTGQNQNNPVPIISNKQNSDQTQNNPPPPTQGTPVPPPPTTSQSGYKDGQYTGDLTDAFYGSLQVKVFISAGKITDVQIPVYPDHAGHSQEVSSYSLPILKSEAIQAQSSNVDIVSGATQTSQAFMQSLASALAKASS